MSFRIHDIQDDNELESMIFKMTMSRVSYLVYAADA